MTATTDQPTGSQVEIRPAFHFTPPSGWLNDPHGLCWVDGRYHLFYQHISDGNEWAPNIHWGHATSPDLVSWTHQPVALAPHADETGCWTGAVVLEDGRPTIFYTSVQGALPTDWSLGRVAVAHPDAELLQWTSTEADVVIDGPPAQLSADVFRDPCIFATGEGEDACWKMIVGVGISDGTGLAVQYSSSDRRSWTYDGVVCSRPSSDREGVWTGTMWECPQLFQVGDDWVLAVSVWDADTLHYVAAAVGSYDGSTFTPDRWSRLTHDEVSYATTFFADKDGRPCLMFWLRENADHDNASRSWAGALSVPMVASINEDRTVRLAPHPDLDGRREPVATGTVGGIRVDSGLDLRLDAAAAAVVEISTDSESLLTVQHGDGTCLLRRPGRPDVSVPVVDTELRILVDAGVVDVFGGAGVASVRVQPQVGARLSVVGRATDTATVYRLRA